MEVRVGRRDLRGASFLVGQPGEVALPDEANTIGAQHVEAVVRAHAALARSAAPVEDAVGEVQPVDTLDRVQLVADPQRDDRGHVPARGLAADEHARRAELRSGVVEEPRRDREPVVGRGGVGVLGRLPVVGRHHHHAELARQVAVGDVHHLGRARDHPAPVEVEVHGACIGVGSEHAATHAGDRALLALGHGERRARVRRALAGDDLLDRRVGGGLVGGGEERAARVDGRPRLLPHRLHLVGPQSERRHRASLQRGPVPVPAPPVRRSADGNKLDSAVVNFGAIRNLSEVNACRSTPTS